MLTIEPLEANTVLQNRYRILGILDKGGMGRVYKALDTQNNIEVAVKELLQINLDAQQRQDAERRFQQEAQMLQGLKNSHIPQFYDYFSTDGRSYLIMELIHGKTLEKLMAEEPNHRLPMKDLLQYACQLCEVLAFLHSRKVPVIFRDLKPSNIMALDGGHIFVIDFGIARFFKPGKSEDTELFATKGFSPPELWTHGRTEPRSDLYSLGATLHFCLTGHPPKDNKPTVFSFPSVRDYDELIPVNLDDLILQLVSTNIDDRPANAEEVLQKLRRIQNDHSSTTEPQAAGNYAMGSYYDPQKARMAQLYLGFRQLARLPGMAGKFWSLLNPLFLQMGEFIVFVFFTHLLPLGNKVGEKVWQGAQSGHKKILQQRPVVQVVIDKALSPPIKLPQVMAWPKFLGRKLSNNQVLNILQKQYWFSTVPALLPLALTSLGSLYLLQGLHYSVTLVILLLVLLLLFVTLGTRVHLNYSLLEKGTSYWSRYAQNNTYRQEVNVQNLLTVTILLLFGLGLFLFMRPELYTLISTSSIGQASSTVLIALGLVAWISTPSSWQNIVNHATVVCIAVLCLLLQYTIPSISILSSGDVPPSIKSIPLVLSGLIALASLFRLTFQWSTLDRVFLLLLAFIYFIQQSLLGTNEMMGLPFISTLMLDKDTSQLLIVNLLFAFLPCAAILWSLRKPKSNVATRLSVSLLAICFGMLLRYQNATIPLPTIISAQPVYALTTQLIDLFPMILNLGLPLLAMITLFRLINRSKFPIWDYIAVFTLAFYSALLEISIGTQGKQTVSALSSVKLSLYLPAAHVLLGDLLLLLLISCLVIGMLASLFHLIYSVQQARLQKAVRLLALTVKLDGAVIWLGRLMIMFSTISCAILQGIIGKEELFATSGTMEVAQGIVLSLYNYLLIFLVLLALFACLWFWQAVRDDTIVENASKDSYLQPFSPWIRCLVLFDTLAILFLFISKGFSPSFLNFTFPTISVHSAALTSGVLLFTAAGIQLCWLYYSFSRLLQVLLIGALIASIMQVFSPYGAIATLILLIGCLSDGTIETLHKLSKGERKA